MYCSSVMKTLTIRSVTEIPAPGLDVFRVTVRLKALCDAVSNLQQAGTSVLQLLLHRQPLVWLIQLLQSLLYRPHPLLTLHTHYTTTQLSTQNIKNNYILLCTLQLR